MKQWSDKEHRHHRIGCAEHLIRFPRDKYNSFGCQLVWTSLSQHTDDPTRDVSVTLIVLVSVHFNSWKTMLWIRSKWTSLIGNQQIPNAAIHNSEDDFSREAQVPMFNNIFSIISFSLTPSCVPPPLL